MFVGADNILTLILALLSKVLPTRKLGTALAGLLIMMTALYTINFSFIVSHFHVRTESHVNPSSKTFLGTSSEIVIISLPNRQDRRRDMERLRTALGLKWVYSNALSSHSPLVAFIMGWVAKTRSRIRPISDKTDATRFSWPTDIEELANSNGKIEIWDDDDNPWDSTSGLELTVGNESLVCATKDYSISNGSLPEYMLLTPARIACWHSHLSVIHQAANNFNPDAPGMTLIFEDDIDMEKDIDQQARTLWRALPDDWDIVFLGHCWSDEARGIVLSPPAVSVAAQFQESSSRLYASTGPKCTHAYALSRVGARRLLLHLRYPLFAYSRAIDQAFAWLVESGRLKSYSIVPSLVVQTKISTSDVIPGNGTGSRWKDTLTHGVLQGIR